MGTTGMIFNKLFHLQGGQMTNTNMGTGKLVNLISNDVTKFEECAVVSSLAFYYGDKQSNELSVFITLFSMQFLAFTWCSILELIAILLILIYELNVASGFAGVGIVILFIPVQILLARQFARIRTWTAHQTDQRVRHISEIIDGMATVKSYAWEMPFFALLTTFRAQEVKRIDSSLQLRAVNLGLYYASPPVAAFATFAVFWATGGQLTLPIVFSTLSLLFCLRTSIGRQWTRSVETASEAVASAQRIERFLDLPENETQHTIEMSERQETVLPSVTLSSSGVKQSPEADVVVGIEIGEIAVDTSGPSHRGIVGAARPLVRIPKSSYYYGEDSSKAVLCDVELEVHRGELLIVVGPVGAGKV
jgi:ABC-type multidrug transport system fused ATPase/permease subunit